MRWKTISARAAAALLPLFFATAAAHEGHRDDILEVGGANRIPSLTIHAQKDARGGWNIFLQTENFVFTPQNINGRNRVNEGYAVLYIDDGAHLRVYSPHYHLPNMPAGRRVLGATLHGNSGAAFAVDGKIIRAEIVLEQPPKN